MNASEMSAGLNNEIDDYNHGWIYGYFFNPSARTLSSDALKDIVVWIDYNVSSSNDIRDVDVPKPGHPYHVPVAVPTAGNYNNWMVVRGIYSDRNAWNGNQIVTGPITIYGFWLNDPKPGGIGNNVYVTASYFTSTYFYLLNVPGDTYNGKYLVITDPDPLRPVPDTSTLTLKTAKSAVFTPAQTKILKTPTANTVIGEQAVKFVSGVLQNDPKYASLSTDLKVIGKPQKLPTGYVIKLGNQNMMITALLGADGAGQQFSIENLVSSTPSLTH
jgi:hypothetical protein